MKHNNEKQLFHIFKLMSIKFKGQLSKFHLVMTENVTIAAPEDLPSINTLLKTALGCLDCRRNLNFHIIPIFVSKLNDDGHHHLCYDGVR